MAYIFGAAFRGIWGSVFPPHPSSSDTDTATTTTSSSDSMDCAEEIPWTDITEAHVSNLRGHVRYLKNIGTKLNVADKLEDYNKRAAQVLADAEAAALIAGIEISPKNQANAKTTEPPPTEPRRRRGRSPGPITTDPDPATDGVSGPKKVKFRSPVAVAAEKPPAFSRRTPPTAAELAQLTSRLGKHERPEYAGYEEMSAKGMKRNRNYYIEKRYWRRQQLEGEETDDEEDIDHVEFAPYPDYIRDRLPETRPAPKRRGNRPFTNELVVPVEAEDDTVEEKSKPLSAKVTTEEEEKKIHDAPKTTTTTTSQKATPTTQASEPEVKPTNPTPKPSANITSQHAPTAPAPNPHPEANKSRKRATAESAARTPKNPTTPHIPTRSFYSEVKAAKHSADEEDTVECPQSTAKRQRRFVQRLPEDLAKRASTAESVGAGGPAGVKRRKFV
ncbi:uncharacterized protein H6S33_008620 [Morchella sextelata]|uniref:uncharacterized protein n=1 Tax=Morchella sextelata TaxID=1174677 RepID=UPI001D03AAEA|nr:uncharacterized protein H6S33_008620 [Morchella sextelata]KAH0602539.1 hypothetical protein H6S33_008620 [Morchella sextelata]